MKTKNKGSYFLRPFNVILRLVQYLCSEFLLLLGVFWCDAKTIQNVLED